MSITINTKSYTADRISQDSVGYVGPANTFSVKDQFQLSRVQPKPTSTFSGVQRHNHKLTRTCALTGSLTTTGEAILAISASLPVGMASADVDALLNDAGSWLSSAIAKTMVKGGTVNG